MNNLKLLAACLLLVGCATQPPKPYKFYSGEVQAPQALSLLTVARPTAKPAIYLTRVNSMRVVDFPAMAGYPKSEEEAQSLEPMAIEVLPGIQRLRVNFLAVTLTNQVQVVAMLALLGASPLSHVTLQKSADIELTTKAGSTYVLTYTWNESKGADGASFVVNECTQEATCKAVPFSESNVTTSVVPSKPSYRLLLAQ